MRRWPNLPSCCAAWSAATTTICLPTSGSVCSARGTAISRQLWAGVFCQLSFVSACTLEIPDDVSSRTTSGCTPTARCGPTRCTRPTTACLWIFCKPPSAGEARLRSIPRDCIFTCLAAMRQVHGVAFDSGLPEPKVPAHVPLRLRARVRVWVVFSRRGLTASLQLCVERQQEHLLPAAPFNACEGHWRARVRLLRPAQGALLL